MNLKAHAVPILVSVHDMAKKQIWQDQVREIESWQTLNQASIRGCAKEFGWSVGNCSEMLNLAALLRCYPDLETEESKSKAIEFMKVKKFHRKV